MSQRRRAVITGLGAVSGFGAGCEALWTALVEGRRAVRRNAAFEAAGLPAMLATIPDEGGLEPRDRATPLALVAAAEAVADAGGVVGGARLAVAVGTTLGGIGGWLPFVRATVPAAANPGLDGWTWSGPAEALARAHGATATVRSISVACASGNAALGAALDEIRAGRADQVIAGGVDALSDFVAAGFQALKANDPSPCRPFDRHRRGLNLGEGACFVVVEEEQHARSRGARVRAFLDGYGDSADANHMTGPDPEGRGAARAMIAALADARLDPQGIDYVSAHGTGTLFNDLMEAKALHAVLGARTPSVPVNSIKGAIGHTLGAAGAFEALVCVRSLETGLIAPTAGLEERDPAIALCVVSGTARSLRLEAVLSTSSGFGGTNAAIVLRRSR